MSIRIGIGLDVFGAGIDADATTIYNRIIADGGVSNLSRLNFFVKGLKAIYGDLANVPVCYDAHWIGYKLGSGTGATAGQAAAKLYSLTVAGDAVQSTAASQPLLLAHNGTNYFLGVSDSGNNCTTPNTVTNQISGILEIICKVNITNSNAFNVTKLGNYAFYKLTNNLLILNVNGISYTSTAALSVFGEVFLKITRESSNGDIKFFTSADGVTYTQLGLTIAGLSGAMATSTNEVVVCNQVVQSAILAKVYRVTISNSIGGTPVVDFNPATYNASTSQTQWTSATGEVWTINTGTATTGYKGVLVDRTIVMSDGVDDRISVSGLTTIPLVSVYQSKTYYPASIQSKVGFLISTLSSGSGEFGVSVARTSYYSNNNYFTPNITAGGLRQLHYAKYKTNSQDFKVNNGTSLTITNQSFAGANCVFLFSDSTTIFMNLQYQTFVMSNIEDTTIQVTAMYNLIRSLNNNSF